MQSDNDSLARLIEDVDKATNSYFYDCGYFRSQRDGNGCSKCPAEDCDSSCMQAAFDDIVRRLHALMPHDAKGVEIKPGDTIELKGGKSRALITDVMPIPASVKEEEARIDTFPMSFLWRVVEPDSWEKLEEDANLGCHDYCKKHLLEECDYNMRVHILARAKKLAGIEEEVRNGD